MTRATPAPAPSNNDESPCPRHHSQMAMRAHTCTTLLTGDERPHPHHHLQPAMTAHACTTTFGWRQVARPPFNSDEGPHLHHLLSTATRAHTCTSTLKQQRTLTPALSNNNEHPYPHPTFNQRCGPTSAPPPSTSNAGPHPHHHLQPVTRAHACTTTFKWR